MKINIFYHSKTGSWGGGNQFLKALKSELLRMGVYSDDIKKADAVILNGYQELWALFRNWLFCGKKKVIYRLGPIMSLHRKGLKWRIMDRVMILSANLFAHIVIFQSTWSYDQARRLGFYDKNKYFIILNAVDDKVFYKKRSKEKIPNEPTRLVYTSWSSNMKKGFKYLKFLDENLDFEKYQFTFIGNSPFEFKNIKVLKALPSLELAAHLRESDIFVSPVEDDACSNALLEGLASGLPAVALNSGGNPEIISNAGELFRNEPELLAQIDKVAGNLAFYSNRISVKSIREVAGEYVAAIGSIC